MSTIKKVPLTLNKVIALLTMSDLFSWTFYFVIASITGLYLANKLSENIVGVVGIGTAIYFLTKGLLQVPIGIFTDKIKKDRDDIVFLLIGDILMGLPYIFYPLINSPSIFYILQIALGIGAAMNLVNWRKLFARNLDKGKEGLEYGLYDTIFSVASAIISLLAGLIASVNTHYFDVVIVVIGILVMTSSMWIAMIFFVKKRKSA